MKVYEVENFNGTMIQPVEQDEMCPGFKSIKDRYNYRTFFVGNIIELGLYSKEKVKIVCK